MKLTGKVAIVTGGAHGIGAAVCEAIGAEGADVVVNYCSSAQLAEETVDRLAQQSVRAVPYRADVSEPDQVQAMMDLAVAEFGRVDILVNNAAAPVVRVPFGDVTQLPIDVWDRIMAVNLKGPFLCTRSVVGPMRETGGGAIVNIGSIGGMRPRSSNLAYATTKAGIVHLTECLAVSLGPDIRVNCVVPGITPTSRVLPNTPSIGPLRRHVALADLASAVVECCRNDSVTGATWVVDAGAILE